MLQQTSFWKNNFVAVKNQIYCTKLQTWMLRELQEAEWDISLISLMLRPP
jgi:hypothetical protein